MMPEGEVVATREQVCALIAAQFPEWAGLEPSAVPSAGTDNAIFRLGVDKCVRLPRSAYAERQIHKECAWLPKLGPLPLEIPRVLRRGEPGEGFPWR